MDLPPRQDEPRRAFQSEIERAELFAFQISRGKYEGSYNLQKSVGISSRIGSFSRTYNILVTTAVATGHNFAPQHLCDHLVF
jgi:hypothetical protein